MMNTLSSRHEVLPTVAAETLLTGRKRKRSSRASTTTPVPGKKFKHAKLTKQTSPSTTTATTATATTTSGIKPNLKLEEHLHVIFHLLAQSKTGSSNNAFLLHAYATVKKMVATKLAAQREQTALDRHCAWNVSIKLLDGEENVKERAALIKDFRRQEKKNNKERRNAKKVARRLQRSRAHVNEGSSRS